MGVVSVATISRISAEPHPAELERTVPDNVATLRPLRTSNLRRLADTLRALARGRKNSREYHLEVARCVIDELYGGKLEALRSEGEESPSFRELARDLGDAIKKTTLHR